mmetsp:Transcript_5272/g.12556  ORF Transcript_5272/g.12556 Transcript_5272/m.12556 type:complete len:250 (-) Transcript_5272:3623-4372(-)
MSSGGRNTRRCGCSSSRGRRSRIGRRRPTTCTTTSSSRRQRLREEAQRIVIIVSRRRHVRVDLAIIKNDDIVDGAPQLLEEDAAVVAGAGGAVPVPAESGPVHPRPAVAVRVGGQRGGELRQPLVDAIDRRGRPGQPDEVVRPDGPKVVVREGRVEGEDEVGHEAPGAHLVKVPEGGVGEVPVRVEGGGIAGGVEGRGAVPPSPSPAPASFVVVPRALPGPQRLRLSRRSSSSSSARPRSSSGPRWRRR